MRAHGILRRLALVVLVFGAVPAATSELSVSPRWEAGGWIERGTPIVLELSRAPEPGEGEIRIFLGTLDVTDLFRLDGVVLRSDPSVASLPGGRHDLVVELATSPEAWREIGRFPIAVLHAGGFERASVSPTVQVDGNGQAAEGHDPASNAPPRETFFDTTLRLGLRTDHEREGLTVTSEVEILGAARREQALRFGEHGEDAPRLDLARYQVRLETPTLALEAGHVTIGAQPQLIEGFSSRGLSAAWQPARWLRLGAAGVNGTSIVGWDNLLGLSRSEHRVLTTSVGVEMIPSRPGGFSLSGAYVDSSILPLVGFNQGAVSDAETSQGWGVRLQASDLGQRVRVDLGFSESTFTNPEDPLLSQGTDLVPVEEVTKSARYARATFEALRGVKLGASTELDLSLGYRHERVDPLYRSPTSYTRADYESNRYEVTGSLGPVGFNGAMSTGRDNLDDVPSILTTKTQDADAGLSVPLSRLFSPHGSATAWWPNLSLGYRRTHQFGVGVPVGGGFSPSHVPDQLSTSSNASLDWQGARWRVGYRWSENDQDNRQPGRENADFLSRAHALSLGLSPHDTLDLGVEVALEEAENIERETVEDTVRLSANLLWRAGRGHSFDITVSRTEVDNDDLGSERRDLSGDATWTWRLELGSLAGHPIVGRIFLRYSNRQAFAFDPIFGLDDDRMLWTVTTGVNLSWGS
jgi:hypothetical protein